MGETPQQTTGDLSASIRIVGVGNILRSDDGVGVRVVEKLIGTELPDNVEALDVGTGGLDVVVAIDSVARFIIVDAVDFGGKPGSVQWFSAEEIPETSMDRATSLHEMRVGEVLAFANRLGKSLSIWVCGIQPQSLDYSMQLTPAVEASVNPAAHQILQKVAQLLG